MKIDAENSDLNFKGDWQTPENSRENRDVGR
jgi:hypothetical protein